MMLTVLLICTFIPVLLFIYVRQNDKKIMSTPKELHSISPRCLSPELIRQTAEDLAKNPVPISSLLPARTGRRYIVVGGAGFLGGWIVQHLIQRGEDPKRIRIVDLRSPTRHDLKFGPAAAVELMLADISDPDAVEAAFLKPWPQFEGPEPEITVIQTAASIRFFEKRLDYVPLSAKVNVNGVQNVVNAARACGATILISTSSASVGVRNTRLLLAPWESQPNYFVQIIRDSDDLSSKPHNHYFSNYGYTKFQGEQLVRSADKSIGRNGHVLRTGCIRPGNGIYGNFGDSICEAYLTRKYNPTWVAPNIQNFVYVENCSLSHLCYEQRLLETIGGGNNPDIGGKAFIVTDAGPPIAFGDCYDIISVLTNGETVFRHLSSTAMLIFAHIIEFYYCFTHSLSTSDSPLGKVLSRIFPRLTGDIVMLQPSMWPLVNCHLVFDDSGASAPPEKGGLGYNPPWTSLTGMCKVVELFKMGQVEDSRSDSDNSAVSGTIKAEGGVQKILDTVESLGVDATTVLN